LRQTLHRSIESRHRNARHRIDRPIDRPVGLQKLKVPCIRDEVEPISSTPVESAQCKVESHHRVRCDLVSRDLSGTRLGIRSVNHNAPPTGCTDPEPHRARVGFGLPYGRGERVEVGAEGDRATGDADAVPAADGGGGGIPIDVERQHRLDVGDGKDHVGNSGPRRIGHAR